MDILAKWWIEMPWYCQAIAIIYIFGCIGNIGRGK
jgi:hypothetical protein